MEIWKNEKQVSDHECNCDKTIPHPHWAKNQIPHKNNKTISSISPKYKLSSPSSNSSPQWFSFSATSSISLSEFSSSTSFFLYGHASFRELSFYYDLPSYSHSSSFVHFSLLFCTLFLLFFMAFFSSSASLSCSKTSSLIKASPEKPVFFVVAVAFCVSWLHSINEPLSQFRS